MNQTVITILDTLQPILTPIISTIAASLGAVIAAQLVRLIGITSKKEKAALEKQLRDGVHAAVDNGIGYARSKIGSGLVDAASDVAVAEAIDYVKKKNPASLKKLGINDDALADIVTAKIGRGQ